MAIDEQSETARESRTIAQRKADVAGLYHLTLRRLPESDATVTILADWTIEDLVKGFFNSAEFVGAVSEPLNQGRSPWPAGTPGPTPQLLAWAAGWVPLTAAVAKGLPDAPLFSWPALYHALVSDDRFVAVLGPDNPLLTPSARVTLRDLANMSGGLDEVDRHGVRGWVFLAGGEKPDLQLWIDGRFVAAGRPTGFRRDIQDRFGGDGMAGFHIRFPPGEAVRRQARHIEVRMLSGLVVAEADVQRREYGPEAFAALNRELAGIRDALSAIEARLPALRSAQGAALSDYAEYRSTWGGEGGTDPLSGDLSICVLIDATGVPDAHVEETVWSVLEDQAADRKAVLILDPGQSALAEDLGHRVGWRTGLAVETLFSTEETQAGRLTAALALTTADLVLLLAAGTVLEPGALTRIVNGFIDRPDRGALYFDEDRFEEADDGAPPVSRVRIDPILRPGFDPDMLRQFPYTGSNIVFRTPALQALGLRPEAGSDHGADALLRLAEGGGGVGHLPLVLATGRQAQTVAGPLWRDCVADAVPGVVVEARTDILGADIPGAARVRHPLPPGASATVVVPTRDGLDLLKPCLDSLLGHAPANRTAMDILIVDHESRDEATLAYLAELAEAGTARIMPYEGPFNWARMNNLAAAASEADVLVFLNNDTVAVSPDWLDELASQALREEVGVVGCRLIYGDGTIQHAGMVARELEYAFLTHEGVGREGADAGYLGRHGLVHAAVCVTGACMAVATDVFKTLGGFDAANFPVEGNDVDLCMRARAQGLKVLYDPYATLYHLESKTRGFNRSSEKMGKASQANMLLWQRWGARFGRDEGLNPHFDRLAPPFTRLRAPDRRR